MRLKFRHSPAELTYPADVARIVSACTVAGFEIAPIDAERAWEEYSDTLPGGVSWAPIPADAEIVEHVRKFCEEV